LTIRLLTHLCICVQAKVSQRAYKFKLLEVKNLCDFFHVDRSGKSTKDDLIDALLDFLGETNEDLLKSSSNKSAPKKKAVVKKKRAPATKKKVVDDDEEEEEEDKDEEEEEDLAEDKEEEDKEIDKEEKDDRVENNEPKQITDKALRRWVQAYVACFNMDKATIKHAMETASDKFGINLKGKKAKIRQFLTEEM
jgi:glutamyl/glutaminyl-tRNA synthetase